MRTATTIDIQGLQNSRCMCQVCEWYNRFAERKFKSRKKQERKIIVIVQRTFELSFKLKTKELLGDLLKSTCSIQTAG